MARLRTRLAARGLRVLGLFIPGPDDGFPELAGAPVKTGILLGNAGSEIWPPFVAARQSGAEAMNRWTRATIDPIAEEIGARALYPFEGPPYWPFQQWALRGGDCWTSPIGVLMHRDFGLWHAFRAVLLLAEEWDFAPPATVSTSPCLDCRDQPCLSSCPVEAFSASGYDVTACWDYLDGDAGGDCLSRGCAARRACPVARSWIYRPEHAAFHMAAFHKAKPKN